MLAPDTYSLVGKSTLALPTMGFGAGPLGGLRPGITDDMARATLEAAWASGFRYYDTAPWYGNTRSEHRVGAFLRDKPRDEFILTTKVGRVFKRPDADFDFENSNWRARWPGGLPFVPHFNYSRDWFIRSYEDSLQRLGMPRVDALTIHDLDTRHRFDEKGVDEGFRQLDAGGGFKWLKEMKRAGEIAAIGVGINLHGLIPRFVENFDIDYFILAMPYNLIDQGSLDDELALCEERGVSVVIGAPFASGILATGAVPGASYAYKPADDAIMVRVHAMEAVCRKHAITLPAAALQFPLAHPAVVSVIPGAESAEHVSLNLAAARLPIPSSFWQDLKSAGLIEQAAPVPA